MVSVVERGWSGGAGWRRSGGTPSPPVYVQIEAVRAALKNGPRANGFATDLWTLARVAEVIEATTGVRYGPTQTWEILRKRLGWSRQRPARRALERNDEAIATWVEEEWPRIKEGPGTAGRGSSSKTSRGSRSSRR